MKLKLYILVTFLGLLQVMPLFAQEEEQPKGKMESTTYSAVTRWAVKSNLLYDSFSFLNAGIECNLGSHWGAELDLVFPWWNAHDNHRTTRMLNAGLEMKYYTKGWRDPGHTLSGFYLGAHANTGIYDWARHSKGYQSDGLFYMGGIVTGYDLYINDTWRLGLSFGVGAMKTSYTRYEMRNNGKYSVNKFQGNYMYYGPTKAEISLAWMIK